MFKIGRIWWLSVTVNGLRQRVSTGTSNKNLALKIQDKVRGEILEGKWFGKKDEEPFKDYAERWYKTKVGIKKATQISYRGILDNHLLPHFGELVISGIQRKHIQDFVGKKFDEGRLSHKTLKNVLVCLHQILGDAEVDGLIARNPYLKIEMPKENGDGIRRGKFKGDYLSTNEIRVFLDSCEPKTYPLFYTAIFTGMRRGELLGLEWDDIDWVSKQIHVRRSLYKGRPQAPKSEYSVRAIDMGSRLVKVIKEHRIKQNEIRLKAWKNWINNDFVFCQDDGTSLDGDNLYHRDFQRTLKRAGLRHIRIHDLRHTFASILISSGHNPKYIQNQMGHGSIQITMDLYGHLMEEVRTGAADRTEDFVFGQSESKFCQGQEKGVTASAATP